MLSEVGSRTVWSFSSVYGPAPLLGHRPSWSSACLFKVNMRRINDDVTHTQSGFHVDRFRVLGRVKITTTYNLYSLIIFISLLIYPWLSYNIYSNLNFSYYLIIPYNFIYICVLNSLIPLLSSKKGYDSYIRITT